jgi:uncharacterized damage-inducible protein DinB
MAEGEGDDLLLDQERGCAEVVEYVSSLTDTDLGRVIKTPWGPQYRLVEMLDHMIEHEIHHRGELSLILGILGREGFNA